MHLHKIKTTLLATLLIGSFAAPAFAKEQVVAKKVDLVLRGPNQRIPVRQTLELTKDIRGAHLLKLFAVAKTMAGHGMMSVIVNGRPVDRRQVGARFESVEFFINQRIGVEMATIQLETDGNFEVAIVGATIDANVRLDDDDFDGRPGKGPGFDPRLVSAAQMSAILAELRDDRNDIAKAATIKQYAESLSNKLFTLDQLGQILRLMEHDPFRLNVVDELDSQLLLEVEKLGHALSAFDNDVFRNQARTKIMNNAKRL